MPGILADSARSSSESPLVCGMPVRNIPRTGKDPAPVGVLIVDDESLIRWSLAEMLSSHGYRVVEAGDGKSALALLGDPFCQVDVVMLDYRLPDVNGLQLLAAIHGASPRSRVVLMTAYGTPEIAAEAVRLGAVCVVDKPMEMSDVADLVQRARTAGHA
ncbi:MAG TPA: response regulator [Vicinamibacterales bacterium]|nr:response regulator [Vicinamibacterales bacterium]